LNKHPDATTGPRARLSVAEANGLAVDEPALIWLNVAKDDYYAGTPTSFEPDR
jgi:hypothetical protein